MRKEAKTIRKQNKKAISPLIATVLLVALVIAAAGAVYVWSKGFIAERIMKFGETAEVACQKATISADYSSSNNKLTINNKGNLNIKDVEIKVKSNGDVTVLKPEEKTPDYEKETCKCIMAGSIGTITLKYSKPLSGKHIEVVPMIMGKGASSNKNKLQMCYDSSYKFTAK